MRWGSKPETEDCTGAGVSVIWRRNQTHWPSEDQQGEDSSSRVSSIVEGEAVGVADIASGLPLLLKGSWPRRRPIRGDGGAAVQAEYEAIGWRSSEGGHVNRWSDATLVGSTKERDGPAPSTGGRLWCVFGKCCGRNRRNPRRKSRWWGRIF